MDNYKKGQRAYEKKDYDKAISYWKPLADEGHEEAINSMGNLYATEDSTTTCLPEDFSKALYYFKKGTLMDQRHPSLALSQNGVVDFEHFHYYQQIQLTLPFLQDSLFSCKFFLSAHKL